MRIAFRFNPDKAIQAIACILSAAGPTEKVKLTKLLYLAERQSFIEFGVTITGDRLVAMKWGPVPSGCLDLLNGMGSVHPKRVFDVIHVDDSNVSLRKDPGRDLLTESDLAVLDQVIRQYGSTHHWSLVRQTHNLPEYSRTYIEGTSTPIPFEEIASAAADERRFRLGRAVISPETAAAMPCPFTPGEDATL